jgi:hypothetical protein
MSVGGIIPSFWTETRFLASHFFLYTDPGSGTLIWQLLLAVFFGGMFYLRRLKDFLVRRKK